MANNIYAEYINDITNSLRKGKKRGELVKGFSSDSALNESYSVRAAMNLGDKSRDQKLFGSLQPLSRLSTKTANYNLKLGSHPDFVQIKDSMTHEQHYIVSMFIDIKNSTGLFRKYDPLTVANITMTIQRAAIHTCWHFDGYIQRLHGDGLLVYFGGKNTDVTTATNNAMNAASFFSYFMKNDIKKLFNEQGVENLYTRIGIDLGLESDVIWHLAGIGECSEITTCSLHTSLAAKMQVNAVSNGIMVGDNIKENTDLSKELYSIKINNEGKEDRYIYTIPDENFYYTQWQFNWSKYLKNHPNVSMDNEGNLFIAEENEEPLKNMDFLRSQAKEYRPYLNEEKAAN